MPGQSEEVALVAFSCSMRFLGSAAKMSSPKDTCYNLGFGPMQGSANHLTGQEKPPECQYAQLLLQKVSGRYLDFASYTHGS